MSRGNHANSQTTKATLGLRELVLGGAFSPGERVPELRLVEQLGVSRTPLRAALMTLEHEGLLEALPGGGFVVREFTRADVDDAIELRGVLEGTAARLAAERLESVRQLDPLKECCAEMDELVHDPSEEAFVRYVPLNEQYHALLVGLAHSPTLTRAIEKIVSLPFAAPSGALIAAQGRMPRAREIIVVAQHQHRVIVEAIERGEGSRAEAVAREHARIARINLDIALENGEFLQDLPGATLIRFPGVSQDG